MDSEKQTQFRNPVFFYQQDPVSKRKLIIEEEEGTVWAYLTVPDSGEIEQDCFLCSTQPIRAKLRDLEWYKKKGMPLPIVYKYANRYSIQPEITEDSFQVQWKEDGVLVKVAGTPFLFFVFSEKRGFTIALRTSGQYGNAWDLRAYLELIGP